MADIQKKKKSSKSVKKSKEDRQGSTGWSSKDVKICFEMYLSNESFYLSEGGRINGAHVAKPYYNDNFGAMHNARFDIIMTGNQADVYGIDETLCQVKHLLKFPSSVDMHQRERR